MSQDFTTTVVLDKTPEHVFEAVTNVRGWWSENIEGPTDALSAEFTHEGLVPAYECFDVCSNAWGSYINGSLQKLIETGQGRPNPKETPKRTTVFR